MAKRKPDRNADLPEIDPDRIDWDRVDDAAPALLHLGRHDQTRASFEAERTWKGFDFEPMNRLHEKGYIDDPVGKQKSVAFTAEERRGSAELFRDLFAPYSAERDPSDP